MYWDTDKVDHLMFERVRSCAQAMDRGHSDWSQEFWCETMRKLIVNGNKEMMLRDAKEKNAHETIHAFRANGKGS